MLASVILGFGLLIAMLLLLRWYANADPKDIKRFLKLIVIWGLGLIAVFLALTGRLAAAFGLIMGIAAFGWRVLNMVSMVQQMRGLFGGLARGFGGAAQASTGQSSQVETPCLCMTLDHDTGMMDGKVRKGQFEGQVLSAMSFEDLLAFHQEVNSDADSLGLLETYLDRAHVGWRDHVHAAGSGDSAAGGYSGPMNSDDAYRVLGLSPGASKREIKEAYRQLMVKVHPDKGGSAYLAAKINQAKDILLGL